MKTLPVICAAIVLFAACAKTGTEPETGFVSDNSADNSIAKKRAGFLVSHAWKYH